MSLRVEPTAETRETEIREGLSVVQRERRESLLFGVGYIITGATT